MTTWVDHLRRLPFLRLILSAMALALVLFGTAYYLFTTAVVAQPVRVHVEGLPVEAWENVRVKLFNENLRPAPMQPIFDTPYFYLLKIWVRKVVISIPRAEVPKVRQISITFGDNHPHVFSGAKVLRWQEVAPTEEMANLVMEIPSRPSSLPWIKDELLNWPGDWAYLRSVGQNALFPCVVIALVSFWCGQSRSKVGRRWTDLKILPRSVEDGFSNSTYVGGAGLLFLIGNLAFLEMRDPYYFTQDDNAIECLPMILTGCRSLWQGEFPDYNPYLFGGAPLASLGMYSLTYPPLYLSYAIARHVLRDEYATIEVFAVLHLLIGYLAMYWLARRVGTGSITATLVALAFALSGASLIMGRSWFNFLPVMTWLPLLFLGLVKLRDGPVSAWWVLGMGVALGMPFHVGFTQAAVYVDGFFFLGVLYLLMAKTISWRRAGPVLAALMLGAGLAWPLLWQQWLFSRGVDREQSQVESIARGCPAMLLPAPLVETGLPDTWGNDYRDTLGQFYFFGGVLGFFFVVQAVGLFVCPRGSKTRPAASGEWMWTICGLFALWLALGEPFGLWTLTSKLPAIGGINRFPLRVMPFVVFFASMSGGLMLERILQCVVHRRRIEIAVAISALLLLVVHLVQCRGAFYVFHSPVYPPLPDELRSLLGTPDEPKARIISWAPQRSPDESYFSLLPHNVPAAQGLVALGGHNPLIEDKPGALTHRGHRGKLIRFPEEALKAYGIRYHVSPRHAPPLCSVYSRSWTFEATTKNDPLLRRLTLPQVSRLALNPNMFTEVFSTSELVVHKSNADVDPLAFSVDEISLDGKPGPVRAPLPIKLHGWGIEIDATSLKTPQWVIVNFVHYPHMQAFLDGQPLSPPRNDYWNRMMIQVQGRAEVRAGPGFSDHSARTLTIRYRPPWSQGLWGGLGLSLAGAALGWYFINRQQ